MALNRKVVEGWRYPDARPELDAIREDVLALMDGNQIEVKALQTERDALAKAIKEKDAEMGTLRTERDEAQKTLAEAVEANGEYAKALDEVRAERDALAGRVLEVEEMLAAEEQPAAEKVE